MLTPRRGEDRENDENCRRAESAGAPALVLPRALSRVRPWVVQSSDALPSEGAACEPMKARATRDKEPEGGPAPTQPQGETPRGGKQHRGNRPTKPITHKREKARVTSRRQTLTPERREYEVKEKKKHIKGRGTEGGEEVAAQPGRRSHTPSRWPASSHRQSGVLCKGSRRAVL